MAEKKKYNSILISGRKDQTLTYSKYVKDEESGESVKESLDKKVNVTDELTTQQIKDGAITNEKIKDKNVTNEKLADNSVSNEKIKDKSITNSKLGDNSVDGRNLSNSSVENRHIRNNAVSTSKIAPRSVTNEKIAYNSVSIAELTPDVCSFIDKKADAEQVNNSLYNLEKKIGDRFVVEGDVTNLPDEEDLTSVKESERNVLKLADRSYSPYNFSGKGYKILRKNIKQVTIAVTKIVVSSVPTSDGYISFIINGVESRVDVITASVTTTDKVADKIATKLSETMTEYEVSKVASTITLTRKFSGEISQASSFSAVNTGVSCSITDSTKEVLRNLLTPIMMHQPNTIYEIRYDFDLDGAALEMPDNCTLKFAGGMLKNGNICSNFTKFQGSPLLKDINIKYNIYDRFGNQISKKSYKEIRKDINVIFSLVGWNEESAKLVCQNANSAQIENVQIIYYTKYDNSSNSISTPELSFLSRGIKAIVDYIQKYRLKIYSIKFHKNSGYSDNPSLEEKIAYGEYVKNVVSEYLKYTDTIKAVFISNEEPDRTCIGNNWNGVHLDLIDWLHGQKIKVGISDLNVSQIINMDNNLYNNIDYPGLNFYPSLSYYDLDTNESHIPNMIENCSCILKSYVDSVRQKEGFKYLSITESGVVCRDKALRRPYDWDNLGERNHTGVIPYLYHKTLLNSCIKTGIPEYYAWYIETEDFNKPIVNDFFDSFMFK